MEDSSSKLLNMESHSIVLEEDNYAEWSAWMKFHLDKQGLWSIVTSLEASAQQDWKDKNLRALHIIWNSCGEKAFSVAKAHTLASVIWFCLEEKFAMLDSISRGNFLHWSARMKSYLMARNLWSVVDPRKEDNEFSSKNWNIKNLEALQAIRRFCDWEALSKTNVCNTARDAWSVLVKNYDVEDGIKADGDNYADWSDKVKSNLMGRGLWNIIEPSNTFPDVLFRTRFKKNVKALKVIQSSCGWEAFSHINDITLARRVWDILGERYGMRERIDKGRDLVDAVRKGNWLVVEECLRQHPFQKRHKITYREETVLHIAVNAGQTEIVEKLVGRMFKLDLYIVDVEGHTALARAAIGGNRQMVECMLEKGKNLISVEDKNRRMPVVLAIEYKHKDLAWYPYKCTPPEVLKRRKGIHSATISTRAIHNEMLDIALDLIKTHQPLALAVDLDQRSPFYALASLPTALSSVKRLALGTRWICFSHYFCNSFNRSDEQIQSTSAVDETHVNVEPDSPGSEESLHLARRLLERMCHQISISSYGDMTTGSVYSAVHLAVREGNFEFIDEILKTNDAIKWSDNQNGRTILAIAVQHRQAKIFRKLLESPAKDAMINTLDCDKNNILHVTGTLPLPSKLAFIPGAAMQMQYEIRWFKEVEKNVSSIMREARNKDDLTPKQLFTKSHGELRKEGEKWMKETATFGIVIVTLVIAVVFAATITTPGGYNEETGWPMLLNKNLFKIYMVCNSMSLVSSSTSVLMFLAILTSRYEVEDFLKWLPVKMMIALFALSLSVAVMMLGFCFALVLVLHDQRAFFIPIICLVGLPFILFITIQVCLIINMSKSTFRSIA